MPVILDTDYYFDTITPTRPRIPANVNFRTFVPFLVDDPAELIVSASVSAASEDSGVSYSIASGNTGVIIEGVYQDQFPGNSGLYVPAGTSDKIETPIAFSSTAELPEGQELYSWVQSSEEFASITYNVTVETDLEGSTTYNLSLIHRIDNDCYASMAFIRNYFNLPPVGTFTDVLQSYEPGYDPATNTFTDLNKAVTLL